MKYKGFTKQQVATITRLKPRQVQFYTEEGVVIPSVMEGKGRGKVRRYSEENLLEFMIIGECLGVGMTLSKLKWTMEIFRRDCEKTFSELASLRINEMVGYYFIIAKDIEDTSIAEWREIHPGGTMLTDHDLINLMNLFVINVGVLIEIVAGGGIRRIGSNNKVISIISTIQDESGE